MNLEDNTLFENIENIPVKKEKYEQQYWKDKIKYSQLGKQFYRCERTPGSRVGKIKQKFISRRENILKEDDHKEQLEIMKGKSAHKLATWNKRNLKKSSDDVPFYNKFRPNFHLEKSRKIFGRPRRKPGHRNKLDITIVNFDENELDK